MKRLPVCAASVTIMVAALTGCDAGADARKAGDPYPTKAAVRAAPPPQPFDAYRGDLLGRVDHAMLILRDICLAEAGFPQLRESGPGEVRRIHAHLRVSLSDFGLASEQEARQRGFGADLPGEPRRVLSRDANFEAAQQRCSAEAWNQLGAEAKATYEQYDELGGQLTEALAPVYQAPIPAQMAQQMADCIEPHYAIPHRVSWLREPSVTAFDIPFGHHVDPPEAAWKPTGKGPVEIGPAIPPRRYVPTKEESEFAVVWFRCTDEAGLQQHRLELALKAQHDAVARHEAQLAALNPRVDALARRAAQLVGDS